MAGSVNKVILVGNLARDPEIRDMNNGDRVANMRLITSDTWKDRDTGERRERPEGHDIVVFNERLVDVVEKYCRKGMKLYVEGALHTRKWQDRDNNDRYSTEVVVQRYRGEIQMLDSRNDSDDAYDRPREDDRGARGRNENRDDNRSREDDRGGRSRDDDRGNRSRGGRSAFEDDLDDDVPF